MPRPAKPALREAEALQALAHPLRVRILEELREPASAAELARRLSSAGAPSRQNLAYHLKALERGGLVRRAGERRSGGFVESLYRASVRSLMVTAVGAHALEDCDSAKVDVEGEPAAAAASGPQGLVDSLWIAAEAAGPTRAVDEVRAVRGRGLEGDRYFSRTGTFSETPGTGRAVTLVESEALTALRLESGIELAPGDARRNIVTRGAALNHLVGREFRVGRAVLRGMRLCEPCAHLARLTESGVLPGLVHRGGLRADVVTGGKIRVGDPMTPR